MMVFLYAIVLSLLVVPSLADSNLTFSDLNVPFTSYDNDFIEPSYILGKNWNETTIVAQESIVQWADWLASQGPWCTFFHVSPLHQMLTVNMVQLSRPPSLSSRHPIIHTTILAGHHSASDSSIIHIH
jgi:hypothetical protein